MGSGYYRWHYDVMMSCQNIIISMCCMCSCQNCISHRALPHRLPFMSVWIYKLILPILLTKHGTNHRKIIRRHHGGRKRTLNDLEKGAQENSWLIDTCLGRVGGSLAIMAQLDQCPGRRLGDDKETHWILDHGDIQIHQDLVLPDESQDQRGPTKIANYMGPVFG